MRDALMMALIQARLLTTEQALVALQQQQANHPNVPMWRIAASLPGIDTARTYEVAAEHLGFPRAELSEESPSPDFVKAVIGLLNPEQAVGLIKLALVPYEFAMDPEKQEHTLILATPDPSHPKVQTFVGDLGMEVELR
ncbi:MAG: hypothetical protein AAGI71_15110, partial [Bacteroidota bacterium]